MYAVFQLSGFQYSAEEGAVIRVPLQDGKDGAKIKIKEVMMIRDGETTHTGTPFVDKATVEAEIMGAGKDDKVTVYKYKRRTKYRLTQGHRQDYTELKINKITAPKS